MPATGEAQQLRTETTGRQLRFVPLLLLGFTIFYFSVVLTLASEKYFWYDELFTVYVCRLPGYHAIWEAIRHGVDFNPPLFYALTRASEKVFGEGLISVRLPEIAAFWVFCMCLFRFAAKRAGLLGGFIAMTVPLLTGVFYYAYEARPHGIALGFCGLALVCWQNARERVRGGWWLFAFASCLLAAFMTHCYALVLAIPFGIVELLRSLRTRSINWPAWLALLCPMAIACLSFIPLLQSYKGMTAGTSFTYSFPAAWWQLPRFYLFLIPNPISAILIAMALLWATERTGILPAPKRFAAESREFRHEEVILALSFLALPVFGLLLGKLINGPFFARYFISAVVGLGLLLGFGIGARRTNSWIPLTLTVLIVLALAGRAGALFWHRSQGWGERILEPSTSVELSTTPGDPLARYSLLAYHAAGSLPIAIVEPLDFFYLTNYAPQLTPRLYFVASSENDFFHRGFERVRMWCPVKYNRELTWKQFLQSYSDFLVYMPEYRLGALTRIVGEHRLIKRLNYADGHLLVEVITNEGQ